jgi:surface protein
MVSIGIGVGVSFINKLGGTNSDFVSTWDTTKAGSASNTIVLPLLVGGVYSGTIDWGDGNSNDLSYANRTHVYASGGVKVITISGQIDGWQFNNTGDKAKITDVSNWGTLNITTNSAFFGCSNLDVSATDAPILTSSSLENMFRGCTSLTSPDFSSWNLSAVSNVRAMFNNCVLFNSDISMWDMSSITFLGGYGGGFDSGMFTGCTIFNQPIGGWNIAPTDIRTTFKNCYNFNQDLSNWDISGCGNLFRLFSGATLFNGDLSSWDTSNIGSMQEAFAYCTSFNRDLSNWDVSGVYSFQSMFRSCTSLISPNITNWDMSSATDISSMFSSATNYNEDISIWNVQNVQNFGGCFLSAHSFNRPVGNWNLSSATLIGGNNQGMFSAAYAFQQDLSSWDISGITNASQFMRYKTGGSVYTTSNYNALLIGWEATLQVAYPSGVGYTATINIDFGASKYSSALMNVGEARYNLINVFGWTITDGGAV